MSMDLKRELLRLLDEDEEFRYAVAGRIGILEILKRLDRLEEGQNKLWESNNRLWEEVRSLREGQEKLWESQNKLWEGQNKLWEEVRSLREGQEKLWEGQEKLWEEVRSLRESQNKLWEGQEKLWEEVRSLREGQNRLWEEVRDMRVTLNRVAVTLDRLTISVEEEALSFIRHRLKTDMGIDVKLERVFIDSREINIYGCSEDVCVVGEAAVRLGARLVDELLNKVAMLKTIRPDLLRPRLIKVIYADYVTPEALDHARENGVWVLKWSGDLTPLKIEYS
ncbi:MAG: hypothetical protein QXH12_07155 [Candidatus Caldarchaeum sp.]|uniref:DUF8196 domain-containing protein n=1 Tax=Caldiarchaeum subterraneum TaxID=311458 RepID=A0A7C5QC98_CALS0